MRIELEASGFRETACFPQADIDSLHRPLLRYLSVRARAAPPPYIVFLAAPAGAGKTLLAAFWEWLSRQDTSLLPAQALPVDGFHCPNAWLDSHTVTRAGRRMTLRNFKGAPETFDLDGLRDKLQALRAGRASRWPRYDRNIHDPVAEAIAVRAPLLIVEGNYLLFDAPGWRDLRPLANLGIFLAAPEAILRERLVRRKARGNYPPGEAEAHVARSDLPNARRILAQRLAADVTLAWRGPGLQDGMEFCERPVALEEAPV